MSGGHYLARKGRHPSKTRVVRYEINGWFEDERAVERRLDRAQQEDVISQYDSGSSTDAGILVWFEGPPGPELRRLRAELLAMSGRKS